MLSPVMIIIDLDTYRCLERGQREGGVQRISELDLSFGFPNKREYDYEFEAFCNGLHFSYYSFLRKDGFTECYISNPWTKESARLPNPTGFYGRSPCGLAFENNSSNDDNNNAALYKIVKVNLNWIGNQKKICNIEMYSSNKKKWQLQAAPELENYTYCKL
ncbi:hypothetical protein MRB53_027574 [Persea americana]|uniref:Uncharacterized protein n=1 Tax=Persea americana TaxID=3435 RepID=A0ACC2LLH2_PERAE|nr:hypothetical protein MRB53_027574 [Persea americana]